MACRNLISTTIDDTRRFALATRILLRQGNLPVDDGLHLARRHRSVGRWQSLVVALVVVAVHLEQALLFSLRCALRHRRRRALSVVGTRRARAAAQHASKTSQRLHGCASSSAPATRAEADGSEGYVRVGLRCALRAAPESATAPRTGCPRPQRRPGCAWRLRGSGQRRSHRLRASPSSAAKKPPRCPGSGRLRGELGAATENGGGTSRPSGTNST